MSPEGMTNGCGGAGTWKEGQRAACWGCLQGGRGRGRGDGRAVIHVKKATKAVGLCHSAGQSETAAPGQPASTDHQLLPVDSQLPSVNCHLLSRNHHSETELLVMGPP